jgi:hypothetical protein
MSSLPNYTFTLPTTGALFFTLDDSIEVSATTIQQANAHRGALRDTLKSLKRAPDKDMLSVIRICQEYLPLLHILYETKCFPSLDVSWRSMFLHHKLPNKDFPRIEFKGLSFELLFTLLTYGEALYNDAVSQTDDAHAADLLCRAAGILDYISNQVCSSIIERSCPETYPALTAALSKIAMATAQLRILTSLQGKTSNAMLCRIAVGAGDLASSAIGLLSAHPTKKVLPTDLTMHCVKLKSAALSQAYVCLSLDAQKRGQIGLAVGCVTLASKLDSTNRETLTLLEEQKKENDQVTFQPVPDEAEVQRQLPSGRDFCKIKPYLPSSDDSRSSDAHASYAGDGSYY